MKLLNIKSKSTLQQLRNNGRIRFSQPQKKIILYYTDSIHEYLEKTDGYSAGKGLGRASGVSRCVLQRSLSSRFTVNKRNK